MNKRDPKDIGYPDESFLIGREKTWDPSVFKKSAESYAEYFIIFDKYADSKDATIAKKALSYMSMGERGLLARGVDSLRLIPYILKNTRHSWIKESMASVAGMLMEEADFKRLYLELLGSAKSDEEVLDILGVAACFKGKKLRRILDWINESTIRENLKARVKELI